MREARVALVAGLALTILAIGAMLSHSPAAAIRTNGLAATVPLGHVGENARLCQRGEEVPRDTSALVVSLSAFHGPRLKAEVLAGARVVDDGSLGSDWTGRTATIPVRPPAVAIPQATICVALSTRHEQVTPFGQPTAPALAARDNGSALPGRMRIEYLASGTRSWWSLAASSAEHMGLGRGAGGIWVPFLAGALMAAAAVTAAAALLRELR
jgi:hypothetical protein